MAACTVGRVDLVDLVDFSGVECLNAAEGSWANVLKAGYREDEGLYLESDCDEQVLLSIPFNQVVKLRSLELRAPGDGTGPRRLKIFTNSPHMGLDEAESAKPVEAFELGPEHRNGSKLLDLYFVKYQNVRSLQVFVESNEGGDELTRVSKLTVLGTPEHTTNMSDFKKSG